MIIKKKLDETSETWVRRQLLLFIEDTETYSYYDTKTYAFEHDLDDWVVFLSSRENCRWLSFILRDKKKKDRAKYKDPMCDAAFRCTQAEIDYRERLSERIKKGEVDPRYFLELNED